MPRVFERKTVRDSLSFNGNGLHSGDPVCVTIHPGESGIWFRRGSTRIEAKPENVSDTQRCTCLGDCATVEHILSALAGLGVTDAEIEVDGHEMPALDGASAAFVDGLNVTGLIKIGEGSVTLFERVFLIEDPIRIGVSLGDGHWKFEFESGERWPYSQVYEATLSPDVYQSEIAMARTFAFEEEVEPIRKAGLAKGLDLTNALILGTTGYVNPALMADEPARHKMLDIIGDISLAGVPVSTINVAAVRSGHRTNVLAALKLSQHAKVEKLGP